MPENESHEERVTNARLQLELRALKSDVRLMIIASVALNQFLANVQLPTTVSVVAIALAIALPAIKAFLVWFASS